jgi:hypothetical protein
MNGWGHAHCRVRKGRALRTPADADAKIRNMLGCCKGRGLVDGISRGEEKREKRKEEREKTECAIIGEHTVALINTHWSLLPQKS